MISKSIFESIIYSETLARHWRGKLARLNRRGALIKAGYDGGRCAIVMTHNGFYLISDEGHDIVMSLKIATFEDIERDSFLNSLAAITPFPVGDADYTEIKTGLIK